MQKTGENKLRKVRMDKKRDIKPTVSKDLKNCIYSLSFITDTPVKDVIEEILKSGVRRKKVISYLSQYFLRDIEVEGTIYFGDIDRVPVSKRSLYGRGERVSTRVTQRMHDTLSAFSYIMGCSISRATALIVDATVRDTEFVNDFCKTYIEENVDEERMRELKRVLKYINAGNPFDERISWAALLNHIMEDVTHQTDRVQKAVSNFMINQWNKK